MSARNEPNKTLLNDAMFADESQLVDTEQCEQEAVPSAKMAHGSHARFRRELLTKRKAPDPVKVRRTGFPNRPSPALVSRAAFVH